MKKAQTVLNNAARFVTGARPGSSTKKLMSDCNWLSVRQLCVMHSVMLLWKVQNRNGALGLKEMFTADSSRTLGPGRLQTDTVKLESSRKCWRIWACYW